MQTSKQHGCYQISLQQGMLVEIYFTSDKRDCLCNGFQGVIKQLDIGAALSVKRSWVEFDDDKVGQKLKQATSAK